MRMNTLKTLILFSCYIVVVTLTLVNAQNSPLDFLDAHNTARAAVGVEDIEWSDEVAAYAQDYANSKIGNCIFEHSQGGPYGENIAMGSGGFTGLDAVKMWVDEQANFNFGTSTCDDIGQCGHYSQVVWRNSVRLGCAAVQCDSKSVFVTCNYDPPGNFIGEKAF